MNINDIPLPPTPPKQLLQNDSSKVIDSKVTPIIRVLPSKRHINNKLPVGVIKKNDSQKINDSVAHRKELFLPTMSDKIQLAMSSIKYAQNKKIEALLNATKLKPIVIKNEYNNNIDNLSENSDKRNSRKRKHTNDHKDIKKPKIELNNCNNEISNKIDYSENNITPVYLKSQVFVKERIKSNFKNDKEVIRTKHNNDYHGQSKVHKSKYDNYDEKSNKISKHNKNGLEHRYSPPRNNHRRIRSRCNILPDRCKYSEIKSKIASYITPKKTIHSPPCKKSSFASSSSDTEESSSSESCNVGLPLVSPKSPEDDDKTMNSDDLSIRDVATATAMANNYLKQLSATLHKMNLTYKNVYSKIPNNNNSPKLSIELSKIPLPYEENNKNGNAIINSVGPKTPEYACDENSDRLKLNVPIHTRSSLKEGPDKNLKETTNSINIENLSHTSNSSYGSKNLKSPHYSLNVSTHSKESDHWECKLRPPLVPKISTFTIDYAQLDEPFLNEVLLTNDAKFFMKEMKCHCSIPNPDEWNQGIISCGNRQDCVLSNLKVECNNKYCPTESLCCNTQFTELNDSLHRMHNIEFFFDTYQSVPWKIRAKKTIQKHKLIFELGGTPETDIDPSPTAKDHPCVLIAPHIKIDTKRDTRSYIYYLTNGSEEQANVNIEKWIVDGNIRVGVFASRELLASEELIVFFPTDNRLSVYYEEPHSITNALDMLACIQYLIHENVDYRSLTVIYDLLLSSPSDALLDIFGMLGGPAVLCCLCDALFDKGSLSVDLFDKFIDMMILVPYRDRRNNDLLGVDLQAFIDSLTIKLTTVLPLTDTQLEKLQRIKLLLSASIDQNQTCSTKIDMRQISKVYVSRNSDILHCRLPPYWSSKECVYNGESRVYFYHRITKFMQWDMPVYPWEANDDNNIDIYDYNMASLIQVSHDEIQQMYINLNKIYELKQKKMQAKVNLLKRKKDNQEAQKKEIFKKKIMTVIINLLKPYRNPHCKEGKIESDDDLHYLTNKLAQTILYKELKILNDKAEHLEVTTQVETKTKAYVKTYMQSRGIIYKRPTHYLINDQKNGPQEANFQS